MKQILEIFIIAMLGLNFVVSAQPFLTYKMAASSHRQRSKPIVLTVKDAVMLAIRRNPNVKSAELERIVQKYALVVAKWQFQPQFGLTGNANYDANTGRLTSFDIAPTANLKTVYGTQFTLSANNTAPGSRYDPRLVFSIVQPLIRGFGREVVEANLKNAIDSEESNKLTLKNTVQSIVTQTILDYLNLIRLNYTLQNDKESLADLEKTLFKTRKLIEAGRSAKTDILRPQSEIASQKVAIQDDQNNIHQALLQLLDDIGLDLNANVVLPKKFDFNALINITLGEKRSLANLDYYKKLTLQNDYNYLTAGITLRTLHRQLLVSKNNQLWQLDLSADKTFLTGYGPSPFSTANDIFKNTLFGLQLSVPIDDKNAKYDLINAEIALNTASINYRELKKQIEIRTENNLNTVTSNKEQLFLSQQALDLQRRNFAVQKIKYDVGMISAFELLTDQKDLVSSERSVIDSQVNYISSLVSFDESIGTILEHWGVTIRY